MVNHETSPYGDTVDLLWPTEVGSQTDSDTTTMIPVPNIRAPRLLVPADNARAASRSLYRFSSALPTRDKGSRILLGALLRAGAARFASGFAVVEDSEALTAHLADALGQQVSVSVGLGTPRANRKPVLEVFDGRGRPLAFAKIGTNALSATLVTSEARALSRLAEARLPARIQAPQLIGLSYWRSMPVLLMSYLPTSPVDRGNRKSPPFGAMLSLGQAFDGGHRELECTKWWASAWEIVDVLHSEERRDRLGAGLTRLAELSNGQSVPIGAWHGDWTPWNQHQRRTEIRLWDWERFEEDVPLDMDRWHFAVNNESLKRGVTPDGVLRGLTAAGLDSSRKNSSIYLSAACYLAAIACRYVGSTEQEGGHLIVRQADVMIESLERLVSVCGDVPHGGA